MFTLTTPSGTYSFDFSWVGYLGVTFWFLLLVGAAVTRREKGE
jgi:hypothetical protein